MRTVAVFLLAFVYACNASLEKKIHVVSHVDTEITSRLTLRDIMKSWPPNIETSYSNAFQEAEYEFCSTISQLFLSTPAGKFEDCRVNNFKITNDFVGDLVGNHIVAVEFVLSFEGSNHTQHGIYTDEVLNYRLGLYPRFGSNIFKKMKYERLLSTIVYNTHEEDDSPFSSRSIKDINTVTSYNTKMEKVTSKRYLLERFPVEANHLNNNDAKRMNRANNMLTKADDQPSSLQQIESKKTIYPVRSHLDEDSEKLAEEILNRLNDLRRKMNVKK